MALTPEGVEFVRGLRTAVVGNDPNIEFKIVGPANLTGIRPTEFKVLIEPKKVEEKVGSIFIPDMTKDSEKYAQIEGRVVAMSHLAFTYASAEEWGDAKPKPGQKVLYAKYAGVRVKGKDGLEYVLVNDKDICATIEE